MIPELSALLRDAVLATLEERVAISFSGGIDSTLIAKVAGGAADVELYVAGMEGSPDMEYAEKIAAELSLPLEKAMLGEKEILDLYGKCYRIVPDKLLKVELLVPVYAIAERASQKKHSCMLFGSGAEELFVGYTRYYSDFGEGKDLDAQLREEFGTLEHREIGWIKRVCRKFSIDARFPFHNRKLADFAFSVPLEKRMEERELKKGLLREAAALLQVPSLAVKRRKQAMQYGSGIHKVLLRHSDELNAEYPAPEGKIGTN
ncbi:hypothetical protein H0O02_03600 [Candidatus Micrarchaeota archaeon]|nr:hypothetical protein [Candidatus Micrarchaeota archaeon]